MIRVLLPGGHEPERRYAVDVLLREFLGLEYTAECDGGRDYRLVAEDGRRLILADAFFGRFPEGTSYLDSAHVPASVSCLSSGFTGEAGVVGIHGSPELIENGTEIRCGVDLFASAFFMLTRWEEHAVSIRDRHERFPAEASLAVRCDFLHRPVVNEYADFLWRMLDTLGLVPERVVRRFRMIPTHDVDSVRRWRSARYAVRSIRKALQRGRVAEAAWTVATYAAVRAGARRDPCDTYDWLMDVSERAGVHSTFYFLGVDEPGHGVDYRIGEPAVGRTLRHIVARGHRVGFHPGYGTFRDVAKWGHEKSRLESCAGIRVTEGRQHYLQFEVPAVWRIWESHGMEVDSSFGYPEKPGFRCGSCYEYPVFDVLARKPLRLRERPLVAMDTTFRKYMRVSPETAARGIEALMDTTRVHGGDMVLLWHNSNLVGPDWTQYRAVYERVLGRIADARA